jgi:hypothetical protein
VIQLGWHVPCSPRMKRTLVAMVLVSVFAGPASAGRPRLNGPEAPRATDLLRAETLAEQAERRLHPSSRKGTGWLRGGSGWDEDGGAAPAPHDNVIIHLHPSRRRAPRP